MRHITIDVSSAATPALAAMPQTALEPLILKETIVTACCYEHLLCTESSDSSRTGRDLTALSALSVT
jgi:hypothetical protein